MTNNPKLTHRLSFDEGKTYFQVTVPNRPSIIIDEPEDSSSNIPMNACWLPIILGYKGEQSPNSENKKYDSLWFETLNEDIVLESWKMLSVDVVYQNVFGSTTLIVAEYEHVEYFQGNGENGTK